MCAKVQKKLKIDRFLLKNFLLFFLKKKVKGRRPGKVKCGFAAVQGSTGFAQFKVKGNLLLLTSDIILQTSYIFFEHPPSPSTLKGLHLSLVFSLLRRKKTAPPVALTLW
jgi:hypothetical protein